MLAEPPGAAKQRRHRRVGAVQPGGCCRWRQPRVDGLVIGADAECVERLAVLDRAGGAEVVLIDGELTERLGCGEVIEVEARQQ